MTITVRKTDKMNKDIKTKMNEWIKIQKGKLMQKIIGEWFSEPIKKEEFLVRMRWWPSASISKEYLDWLQIIIFPP